MRYIYKKKKRKEKKNLYGVYRQLDHINEEVLPTETGSKHLMDYEKITKICGLYARY